MKLNLFIISIISLLCFNSVETNGQCFENVKYKVVQDQNGIEIQFSKDYSEVEVNLEDALLFGNDQFEESITIKNVTAGSKHLVFKDLKPSKYLIQLVVNDCNWVLGGINGIIIEEDEK